MGILRGTQGMSLSDCFPESLSLFVISILSLPLSFLYVSSPPLPPVKTDRKGVVYIPCLQTLCFQALPSSAQYINGSPMSSPNLYPSHPETRLPCDRDSDVTCGALVSDVQICLR